MMSKEWDSGADSAKTIKKTERHARGSQDAAITPMSVLVLAACLGVGIFLICMGLDTKKQHDAQAGIKWQHADARLVAVEPYTETSGTRKHRHRTTKYRGIYIYGANGGEYETSRSGYSTADGMPDAISVQYNPENPSEQPVTADSVAAVFIFAVLWNSIIAIIAVKMALKSKRNRTGALAKQKLS